MVLMLEELMKLLTSTAIFLPSFSAANTFSAPRSISSLMRSLRMVNGSLVIVYPSLMRASLTVSWKISLADISYFNFWVKNAITKGERGAEQRIREKKSKGQMKSLRKRGEDSPKTKAVVLIMRVVPVAIGSTTAPRIVVPRTTAQQVKTIIILVYIHISPRFITILF